MRSITIKKDELLTPFQIAGMIAAKMYPHPDTMGIEEIITAKQTPVERHDQAAENVLDGSTPKSANVFHITTKLNDADRAFVSELAKAFPELVLRSPKSQWDKFKKAWNNSPNKPDWIPVFIDSENYANEHSRVVCAQGHHDKIMELLHSGVYRIVDRNRVPQQSLHLGDYLVSADIIDYLHRCGIETKILESPSEQKILGTVTAPKSDPKKPRVRRDGLVEAVEAALSELGYDAEDLDVMEKLFQYAELGLYNVLDVIPGNNAKDEEQVVIWKAKNNKTMKTKLTAIGYRIEVIRKKMGLPRRGAKSSASMPRSPNGAISAIDGSSNSAQ